MATADRDVCEKAAARAVKFFNDGFNCAEAVATAVAEGVGLSRESLPRIATCFGGGLGRRGETCGAVIGALMAVGLARGRAPGEGDDAKTRAYALAEVVVESFREKFGKVACRELINIDLSAPEGREAFKEKDIHHKYCVDFVAEAARLAYKAASV